MGPNGLFLRLGQNSTTILGSTHVVEQISFSLFLSNPTFIFDLIHGLYLGLGKGSITVFGSTHVVEQLLFSMLP